MAHIKTSQSSKQKASLLALIVVLAFFCFCGVIASGFAFLWWQNTEIPIPTATLARITDTPTPSPKITVRATATPTNAEVIATPPNPVPPTLIASPQDTVSQLASDVPLRDLRALASRLTYGGATLPETIEDSKPVFALGTAREFWVSDDSNGEPRQFQSTATLQYITPHTYWWVENNYSVDKNALQKSAERFEAQTYPTNREFFGSEWSPGVDNDVHLSIFLGNVPGVGGYFASVNEFVPQVNPYSNAMEIFFINLAAMQPGNSRFDAVLAHEFQHMIHWHQDRNEETWVNEGLSELATDLNGFDAGNARNLYLYSPDLQLNGWGDTPSESVPHYGASYLFMQYFLDRFGEDLLKAVVANPKNGIAGFNDTLHNAGFSITFDDIFADFLVANYLNDSAVEDGIWGYQTLKLPRPQLDETLRNLPVTRENTVSQYGVDYVEIDTTAPISLTFSGDITASVVNNSAHSGNFQWYSNRGDDSDMTLTRAVDLRSVQKATLNYWVWFDIEEDWDYAYVEISADNGTSWQILQSPLSRNTNPSGNAYGAGYTGTSNGWREERLDLSAFAGQEILLRFEYITDDAVTRPGLMLDDIAIPEIGFFDDAESPDAGWDAQGFVRIDNIVPQRYVVQLIEMANPPKITKLPLDESNRGSLWLDAPKGGTYILVISALAPVTTETAHYQYRLN